MRYDRNFNPEWGYLAPAPSVIRTARLIAVAAIIGATAGAATVFSLLDRPVAEESVAARTLVTPDPRLPVTTLAAHQSTEPQQMKSPAEAQNSAEQKAPPAPEAELVARPQPTELVTTSTPHTSDQCCRPRRDSRSEGVALCSDVQRYNSGRGRSGSEAAKQETAQSVANRAAYRCSAL
jgi:hypothetical protein